MFQSLLLISFTDYIFYILGLIQIYPKGFIHHFSTLKCLKCGRNYIYVNFMIYIFF